MLPSVVLIVTGAIEALSPQPTGFLQYFYAIGLVIWLVKTVPEMTCNVSIMMLNLHSLTR